MNSETEGSYFDKTQGRSEMRQSPTFARTGIASMPSSPLQEEAQTGNRRRRGRIRINQHQRDLSERLNGSFEQDDMFSIEINDVRDDLPMTPNNAETTDRKEAQYASGHDPLILFGFDLSNLRSSHQFYICASGVFGFTLIYAYLQEILSVHIANRQYALFVSTTQLFGYAVWSFLLTKLRLWRLGNTTLSDVQMNMKDEDEINGQATYIDSKEPLISNPINVNESIDQEEIEGLLVPDISPKPTQVRQRSCTHCMNDVRYQRISRFISYITNEEKDNKTRNGKVPMRLFIGLSIIRAIDVGMTNSAMKYLNFPAKTMIKSSRVVFTMIFGILISKKKYKFFDYLLVLMLVVGLSIFLHADRKNDAVFHPMGVLMLVCSLMCDATVVNFAEVLMKRYHISQDEYLQRIYSISFSVMLMATIIKGEFISGIQNFIMRPGTISEINQTLDTYHQNEATATYTISQKVIVMVLFTCTGLFGSSCAAAITKRFGALTMSIASTVRKAVTLFISLALPGLHNTCTGEHIVGMIIFLIALFSKSMKKEKKEKINARLLCRTINCSKSTQDMEHQSGK